MKRENQSKKEKASDLKKLGKKIKSVDIFGEGVGFNIGGETSTH